MKKLFPFLIFLGVTLLFFYKFFLFLQIPIAGDLLVAEYNPWKTYSYLGYNPGSIPNKAQYFDTIRQIYPWKTQVIDSFKNFSLPLWNPYNFSGSPLLANIQSSAFYPLNILYFVLPEDIAWSITVILQMLFAAFFTYFYCRSVKLEPLASIFSSVAYSSSLFMSVFLEYNTIGHIMALLPLSLFSIEKLLLSGHGRYGLLFGASIAFSSFAGHLQLFVYSVGFIFIYGLFRTFSKEKVKSMLGFLAVFILSVLLCGIQLFPTLELLQLSARQAHNIEFFNSNLLIQINQIVVLFVPDFFGNPASRNYLLTDAYPGNALYIGVASVIFAFLSFSLKSGVKRFFTFTSVTIMFLIIRSPITEAFYTLPIPMLSSSSPSNMIFLISFSLSVLAGFGLMELKDNLKFKSFAVLIIVLAIVVGLGVFMANRDFNHKNAFLSVGLMFVSIVLVFLLRTAKGYLQNVMKVVVIVFTVLELFYFFQKFNPFVERQLVFPDNKVLNFLQHQKDTFRFWGYHSAGIEANFATQYKIFSTDGYDPLYPRYYGEFMNLSKKGKLLEEFDSTNRSDAVISQTGAMEQNLQRKRVLDFLGVKYVLDHSSNASSEKEFPPDKFRQVFSDNGWKVFENLEVFPRAFLAGGLVKTKSRGEFEKYFTDTDFSLRDIVLVDEKYYPVFADHSGGEVKIVSYLPNKVELKTVSKQASFLVLTDTYFPGWTATIDGKQTPVHKAYHSFRMIEVPSGEHKVKFEYFPVSFKIGVIVSIIGMMGMVVYSFFTKKLYGR